MRILLVDDDERFSRRARSAARDAPRHRGRRPSLGRRGGRSALSERLRPDVVLIDLADARGSTASRRRARSPTPAARAAETGAAVVMLSGSDIVDRGADAASAGAIGYIRKTGETLGRAARRVLARLGASGRNSTYVRPNYASPG